MIWLKKKMFRMAFEKYFSGVVVYGLAILFYSNNSYYLSFIKTETGWFLRVIYGLYLVIGLPIIILSKNKGPSRPQQILQALKKVVEDFFRIALFFFTRKEVVLTGLDKTQKTSLLFALVKFIYVPIMLNFFFENFLGVYNYVGHLKQALTAFDFQYLYRFILKLIFTLDTLYFAFGYFVEHSALKNVVKSVESTFLGWMVALVTYPPLNFISGRLFGWYVNENFEVGDIFINISLKLMILFLLMIYLWATLSLGTKCSNLTNRGIINRGVYKYVRHPAYASKVIAWWLMSLTNFSLVSFLSMLIWSFIYYLRAITEERHLIRDKDYQKYVRVVKWRFIPMVI